MRTLVILVDYHGAEDTIECLESLLRMRGDFDVVAIDNSGRGILADRFTAWIEQGSEWSMPDTPLWRRIGATPRRRRPERVAVLREDDIDRAQGGQASLLTVISAKGNRGFAAGNNLGLRFGISRGYDHFWLLNNDTVVLVDTLEALLDRAGRSSDIGICGATVALYHTPDRVQCFAGARFDRVRARSIYAGYGAPLEPRPDRSLIEAEIDMVVGACMFVSRSFLETVGAMEEGYFLYFEEMDWSLRNGNRFRLAYAPNAVIYHKHGSTTGHAPRQRREGATAMRYLHPNRIVFVSRFFPENLIRLRAWMLVDALNRLVRGDFSAAVTLVCTALAPVPDRPSVIPALVGEILRNRS